MIKTREYLARAKQYEERAKRERVSERKEWQLVLASAYRMLANEAEPMFDKKIPQRVGEIIVRAARQRRSDYVALRR
jgi:hypothetical protein